MDNDTNCCMWLNLLFNAYCEFNKCTYSEMILKKSTKNN